MFGVGELYVDLTENGTSSVYMYTVSHIHILTQLQVTVHTTQNIFIFFLLS